MTTTILDTALELVTLGYSVLPIRADGSKASAVTWKPYTTTAADETQVRAWFEHTDHGLAVVQGAVSGGAELAEIEGRAAGRITELRDLAAEFDLLDLWQRLTTGWLEMSPSGGFHFHYRVTGTPVPGNLKLARAADKVVLAETRGEGGYVVVAPSGGTVHPTGRAWTRIAGGPATAPVLDADERELFHLMLRTLDETPEPAPGAHTGPVQAHDPRAGITPGDDYENRTDWTDILTPHGWTLVTTRGRTRYWRRPGKNTGLWSASTGRAEDRDRLFVWSSSTEFEPEVPYTKLGAYALLNHDGDHSAAAKALAADGFGKRAEHPRLDPAAESLDGILAPPAVTPTPATVTATPQTVTPPPATVTAGPAIYTETDDGNALRLVDAHDGHIRYVPQREAWLVWDGARWRWDHVRQVVELARDVARNLPEQNKAETKHKNVSLSRRGIEAMVGLARSDRRTATNLGDLDSRPYELNTPAGPVDLRTGQLLPADPTALHTRSTSVAPDLEAAHPLFDRFLADTFAGDPAMTTYIQRLLGVTLVGVVLEQILPFGFGAGANGKTTLAGTTQRILGIGDDGYSLSAPAELLLATRNAAHPTEIARLAGARQVIVNELEDNQAFAEAKIKMLTGKDTISGRFMGKDWFSFTPTHSLWLLANHKPNVRSGGPAFWRRVRMLGFVHTVPEANRIADLEDRLVEEEGSAILGWMITGARDYFAHGLATPDSVLAATQAYEHDTDTVARFVEDRCEVGDPNAQHMNVRTTALRSAYEHWCRVEDETPVSAKALTQQLGARFGVQAGRSRSARYYSGIRLTDPSPEDDEASRQPELADGW